MENSKSKRQRIRMNINWKLPSHLIQVIFSKLSILNMPVCRRVCKSWNDLILNKASACKIIQGPTSFFYTLYSELYTGIDFDRKCLGWMSLVPPVELFPPPDEFWPFIINSCNGLLLIFNLGRVANCACILNPMTNEHIKLPGGNDSYEDDETFYRRTSGSYRYGLAFSPKTKRYKVARICINKEKTTHNLDIFTFDGSNQWRCVDSLAFRIQGQGIYLNGALYWIGIDQINGYYVICRLDVESEKIEQFSLQQFHSTKRRAYIQPFNGTIYAIFIFPNPLYKFEAWSMQKYDSWTREFVINDMPKDWLCPPGRTMKWIHLTLLKYFEDGEILCLVNHVYLILYNPKNGKIKTSDVVRHSSITPVDSINFGSLQKILAVDDG